MKTVNELLATGNYEICGGNDSCVLIQPKSNGTFMRSLNLISEAYAMAKRNGERILVSGSVTRLCLAK